MEALVALLIEIFEKHLLANEPCRGDEDWVTSVLGARYEKDFESNWMLRFSRVRHCLIAADTQRLIDKVREQSFKAAWNATRNSELSGLVGDDFELIVRFREASIEDPWTDSLLDCYRNGRFPR